ncbi:hypothetical protein V8C35DRAFT_24267 [Trichoderma chlorosporum]
MIFRQENQKLGPYIRQLDYAKSVQNSVEIGLEQIANNGYCLKFDEIRDILRAGLNLRSCGKLDDAKALLTYGTHYTAHTDEGPKEKKSLPDFISVIGGFSRVVGRVVRSESDYKIPGKPDVHVELELAISAYVESGNPDDSSRLWLKVNDVLKSFTDKQRELICRKVTEQLIVSMRQISQGQRTYLVMAPARDMVSTDPDAYGLFGKTGGAAMTADQFDQSVIIDSSGSDSNVDFVPVRLVWAFAEHAERLAFFKPTRALYDSQVVLGS